MTKAEETVHSYNLGLTMRGEAENTLKAMGYTDPAIRKVLDGHPLTVLAKSANMGQLLSFR